MPYDFYIKHNMHAIEWKVNAQINKTKIWQIKSPRHGDIRVQTLRGKSSAISQNDSDKVVEKAS